MKKNFKEGIVFGSSGLIGSSLIKLEKKKFVYSSRKKIKLKKIKWTKFTTNSKKISRKNYLIGIFLCSPRYIKKNFKSKILNKELILLKKILEIYKFEKFIYLSSSTVYQANNPLGKIKKKCEIFLKKKSNLFKYLQIWRPYNLVGYNQITLSDHFHNKLFKIFFINRKKTYFFYGNKNDQRGYSDVDEFAQNLLFFLKKNKSFIKNFGNKNTIKINQIVNLYNKEYFRIYKKFFSAYFLNKKSNINSISNNNRLSIFSKKTNESVFKNYLKNMIKIYNIAK